MGRQWVGIDLSPKAVELVEYRLKQQEPGIALWASKVTARTDIPRRTDMMAQTKNQAGRPMSTADPVDTDLHLPDLRIKGFRGENAIVLSYLYNAILANRVSWQRQLNLARGSRGSHARGI